MVAAFWRPMLWMRRRRPRAGEREEAGMSQQDQSNTLTDSLEDYLETIYQLVRDKKFARVKDIAQARQVRPGSVSPAMRRLADLGLIEYVRREYIKLTPEGEERARRIVARHRLLRRLFEGLLRMPRSAAEAEACAMEHSLSADAMERLVHLFEFLSLCPEAQGILAKFHHCDLVTGRPGDCSIPCPARTSADHEGPLATTTLLDLAAGEKGRVIQLAGSSEGRQRLLNMGIMPEVVVSVDLHDHTRHTARISLQGFQLSITADEAASILVDKI